MMMNLKLVMISLFGIIALSLVSCGDDPVVGCTNVDAENYNSLAEEDSGDCVFARDKFLNEFEGKIKCGLLIPDSTEFTMVITEGLSGNNAVEIEFRGTPEPLPIISATASGDSLILTEKTYVFPLNDVPQNVDVSGFAILNMNRIDGTLYAKLSGSVLQDQCGFLGTKIE